MKREDLAELHYITHMNNIRSILRLGILSHKRASRIEHTSVSMQDVQDRRALIVVPGGRKLHDYVNLYICARNPMLFKRLDQHLDLCVMRVSTEVLDLQGVVVTDANASSEYRRFAAAPRGLRIVDKEATFAEYWTDENPILQLQKKSAKCAEVLVPDKVEPKFISEAYVSCQESLDRLNMLGTGITATINGSIFFR